MRTPARLFPLLAFAPLLITTLFYAIPGQNGTSHNVGGISYSINNQHVNMNPMSERGNPHFLITLHSGYKTIYERKATFGAMGFGEDGIPVNGFITAVPYNKTVL